jgi:hypothetical protein
MSRHVLLEFATRRPFCELPHMPDGATYETQGGCWKVNGTPLVNLSTFQDQQTKKCDLETGEDMKGE